MAELTFKSAGVSTREIDLSGPTAIKPQGVPAGVIGTAQKGPAFVPVTVATWKDFVAEFGGTDGKKFGPLAMNEWMKNARAGTYVRVLGVGDAAKRDSSTGAVTNAGFVVGAELPQSTDNPGGGQLGINPYAYDDGGDQHCAGRTFFLGAMMRENYASDGEAAAVARLTFDPTLFVPAELVAQDDKGFAITITDSDGGLGTIWFHEGPDNLTSAGQPALTNDLNDFEDAKNIFVSVGSRGNAVLRVDNNTMEGLYVELTDVDIDPDPAVTDTRQWQAQFQLGGGAVGDFTSPTVVDIDNGAGAPDTPENIAIQIAASITASPIQITAVAVGADVNLTTDVFGNPSDEPDGGAFIAGHLLLLDAADTDIRENLSGWGGAEFTASELAERVVAASAAAVPAMSVGVTLSADGDDLVITQDKDGIAGNFGETGALASGGSHAQHTIEVASPATSFAAAESFTVTDLAGNSLVIVFTKDETPGANEVSCAEDAVATATIITDGAPASILANDPDTVTITDTAGDTLTITAVAGIPGDPVQVVGGISPNFTCTLNINSAVGVSAAQDLVTCINASAIDISAAVNGTNVDLTQGTPGSGGNTSVGTNFEDEDDFSLNGTVNFSGGVTAQTESQMAARIEALISASSLEATTSIDTATVTIDYLSLGIATPPADTVGTNLGDSDLVATAVEAGTAAVAFDDDSSDDGGAPGTDVAGLTDSVLNFSGGGDSTEGAVSHKHWIDAGINTSAATSDSGLAPLDRAFPIIRAVLMTPQGVHASLVCHANDTAAASETAPLAAFVTAEGANANGGELGVVTGLDKSQERFTLLLNGHIDTSEFPNSITCSLDPQAPDYFMNILNHDAACMEKAGHYIYAHYNVYNDTARVSGHEIENAHATDATQAAAVFLVHGKTNDNTGAADEPCFEDFRDRFRTAKSPWVVSQVYGAKPKNLFRLHALDDGVAGSGKFKITIANVLMSSSGGHGTFDVHVRDITDDDNTPRVYEKFLGLDLNPQSDRYIARVIGDQYMYYDFDKRPGSQKLVVDGIHPARSKFIRVEMDPRVDSGGVPSDALPMGYRGYHHLNTDAREPGPGGLRFLQDGLVNIKSLGFPGNDSILNDAIEPPVPMRNTIATGTGPKKRASAQLCWGTHFQVIDDNDEPNKNVKFNDSILSHGKYFPTLRKNSTSSQPDVSVGDNAGAQDIAGGTSTQDSDRFNNNFFSLERIQIVSKRPTVVSSKNPNVSGKVDHKQWAVAEYRRDGKLNLDVTTLEGLNIFDSSSILTSLVPSGDVTDDGTITGTPTTSARFLDPQTDMADSSTRRFMKFSFFLQGGFDGTNVFNKEKRSLSNRAAVWEMDDADQGGVEGSTVAAFRKAVDVMAEKADVDIKLLAVPGMREEAITDYAIDAVEDRFDAMYIMDIEEKAVNNDLMIDYSSQKPSVSLTVEELAGRNLDSSFAAAYFPDVVITDPALGINVQCPPSVAVLGAFSLNDSIAHPWFAPAGFSRGALKSVVETQVKLSRRNLDTLYESDVNPLAAFPHTPGVVVWGQKTLQQAQSALDRVNVRRLLIEIRREVRKAGNNLLFEPNREETLGRFSAAVNPILQRIQQQQGLDKFKVVIDTTTTTQADIENNTVRGKIFLQPTRTVEFISLDFVVTNAGMEV